MRKSNRAYLSDYSFSRSNNLGVIKFFAALAVIISHAYPLSKGAGCKDFVLNISNNTLGLGGIAVAIFFISSGFFISKSLEKNSNIKKYLVARIKRIFPPLWFVLLFVIIICALFFTTYSVKDYFLNSQLYIYCLNFLLIPIHSLPGVFLYNIYPNVINGALWTLPIEFVCYIGLLIIYKLNMMNKQSYKFFTLLLGFSFILVYFIPLQCLSLIRGYLSPFYMFYLGSLFWVYKDIIVLDYRYFVASLILFLFLTFCNFGQIALCLFFPYIIVFMSFHIKQCSNCFASLGNYSYGIYLFGWPIQQMVVSLFGGEMPIFLNCIISIPLAIIGGILVYNVIEKRIA